MQQGRSGMGSHKHGVSGTSGLNRRELQKLAREVNRATEVKKRQSEKRKGPPLRSVQELMVHHRKKL